MTNQKFRYWLEGLPEAMDYKFDGDIIDLRTGDLVATYNHKEINVRADLLNINDEQAKELYKVILDTARAGVQEAADRNWLSEYSIRLIYLALKGPQ